MTALELISDTVLERMDADGWTPDEVRRLIRSYRELTSRDRDPVRAVARRLKQIARRYKADGLDDEAQKLRELAQLLTNTFPEDKP